MNKRAVVIAGNGPSLAQIDYSLLPRDFDVFRCNQFYFEDKYFLGKKIQAVFFNPMVFFEQYYTLKQLEERGEYCYEEVYSSMMHWAGERDYEELDFKRLYPEVKIAHDEALKCPRLASHFKYQDMYFKKRITSGMLMLFVAAIKGYREIYLAGIDFYETGNYAFEHKSTNANSLIGYEEGVVTEQHSKEVDLEALDLIRDFFDLHIYALCPQSPIASYLSIPFPSPANFFPPKKKEGYICDILIPQVRNPLLKEIPPGIARRILNRLQRYFGFLFPFVTKK